MEKLANNIQVVMGKTIDEREPLRKLFQNQKLKQMVSTVNSALPLLVHRNASLTEINQVHYAAALTIQREILPPPKPSRGIRTQQISTPKWKQKLTEQIS